MNWFDTYYNIIIGLVKNIVDSNNSDIYYDLLSDAQKDRFVTLSDPISHFLTDLKKKKRNGQISGSIGDLSERIEAFNAEFSDYPNLRIEQIRIVIIICNKVASFVNNTRLNPSNFILIPVIEQVKPFNYLFYGTAVNKSALIFSLKRTTDKEIEEFQQFIDNIPNRQVSILFYLLSKLGGRQPLNNVQYILVNNTFKNFSLKIISLLKLCSVCDGNTVHIPYEVERVPQIVDKTELGLQNSYSQFLDSIDILSEYNYEKDILNKYLRIYHVVENFMYKIPIVELMTISHGRMFSIRNFKNLYSKIDKSEQAALNDFMKTVFSIERVAGTTFMQSIQTLWNSLSLVAGYDANQIDNLFLTLKISYTSVTAGANNNTLDFYCKLVYQMRNSIVHNKETEYHILHSTLNPIVPFLMKNFLFPSLEEICFKLIIEAHTKVKYTKSSLQLFQE